ncbi:MAG: deoxyribose-phosphate aldolase [Bacteriovoracaceae bacterium]|nr:deoxyribose-phosphate aldolase [Bacteriovoracaceae bacterium]
MEAKEIASRIDHTLLKANATEEELKVLCHEAREYTFATVCVNPSNIQFCKKELEGCPVGVCTVIGFPLGANTSATKSFETKNAIELGADEVDMVINVGAMKNGNYDLVKNDIKAVVDAAGKTPVKVIIETCLLTDDEKVKACEMSKEVGASFVKTSTGFSTGGATKEDIFLMRKTVGPELGVKASGGVRSSEDAEMMIANGATRIGASSSVKIVTGLTASGDY